MVINHVDGYVREQVVEAQSGRYIILMHLGHMPQAVRLDIGAINGLTRMRPRVPLFQRCGRCGTNRNSSIAAVGVWMLTLAFGISSSVWPEIVRPHPYSVAGFGLLGLAMMFFPWMRKHYIQAQVSLYADQQTRMSQPPNWPPELRPIKVEASPEVSPTITASPVNTVSPVFSPVINIGGEVLKEKVREESRQSEELIPQLIIKRPYKLLLDYSGLVFTDCLSSGKLGLILPVENREAVEGQRAVEARSMAAVVRFSGNGGLQVTAQRAYWLHRVENQINIPVGESKGVVIGLYDTAAWLYFINGRKTGLPPRMTAGQLRNLFSQGGNIQPYYLFLNPTVDVEVSIISVGTGHTLVKKSYRLSASLGAADFLVEELS